MVVVRNLLGPKLLVAKASQVIEVSILMIIELYILGTL